MKIKKYITVTAISIMAAATFIGCQNKDAENQEAYRKIGINSMAEGDYEKAVKSFQKALDISTGGIGAEEIDICYYKAAAQYAGGAYDDAIETYTALIDYDKKNAEAYFLRGSVYLNQGKTDKALKDYKKAVEADMNNYEMYEGIYQNLANHDQKAEGEKYLKQALDLKPKTAEDYAQRGHIYYFLEDYDNAKKNLDKAIDKNDKNALLYLAEVYNAMGQTENAQGLLENYVKNNSGDSEALNTLGMMQLNDKNYEDALKYFELGLKVKNASNRQELMKNQIAAYEYMGDFESAKEKMKSYLKEYPNDESAVRENTFLKTR